MAERKVMAPAAVDPAGADDKAAGDERPASKGESRVDALMRMPDEEFDALVRDIRHVRQRRAREPREPSFGISEGERAELEATGKAVSPFTGEVRTSDPR